MRNETTNYKEVKRCAEVGDKVRIVNAWATSGNYQNGDLLEVGKVDDGGFLHSVDYCIAPDEYVVLEPVELEPIVETSPQTPDLVDMVIRLSREVANQDAKIKELESSITPLSGVDDKTEMLMADVITLDERTRGCRKGCCCR